MNSELSFGSLLVADRGESAVRIVRSARSLGLRTVAVFRDSDRAAPHVAAAHAAVSLATALAGGESAGGPSEAPALDAATGELGLGAAAILAAARASGATAVYGGNGPLARDVAFAQAVTEAGLIWVGPTPRQIELFASRSRADGIARTASVPVVEDAESCHGVRHVEVQVFGDGAGRVLILGDRDCSLQRHHRRLLDEAPAPGLPDPVRAALHAAAQAICAAVSYRSAGTVEFLYDPRRECFHFLGVAAMLDAGHPVIEEILGIDLVNWVLRLAGGDRTMFEAGTEAPAQTPVTTFGATPVAAGAGAGTSVATAHGHAVQARVDAVDPDGDGRSGAGTLTDVQFPAGVRVDTFVSTGSELAGGDDPLLAKLIVHGADRTAALASLGGALDQTRLAGVATNLGLLRAALLHAPLHAVAHSTVSLQSVRDREPRIDVLAPGTMTTVQDWPGRLGLWPVGVPPSGPFDDRAFRAGNGLLGNPQGAPGLECTLDGPTLRFSHVTVVCLTGARSNARLDGESVCFDRPIRVPAGATLAVGAIPGPGLRTYVTFAGGLDVPEYLGSRATFTLGQFGGHGGRALVAGDVLCPVRAERGAVGTAPTSESGSALGGGRDGLGPVPASGPAPVQVAPEEIAGDWELGVLAGPHGDAEFFTAADIEAFYATAWEVHFNSARTGIRLVGPRPQWARADGGEAGLHPSNIHDTPYAVGAVDYTGDTPILLGPDGPSLGGFVCPATVTRDERWKLGQLRPGDRVRFRPRGPVGDGGVLRRVEARSDAPAVTYRRSGDENLLIEYGEMALDLGLRMRVHVLAARLQELGVDGIIELTPGIRSLQIHVDPDVLPVTRALALAASVEESLPGAGELVVPSRTVRMPLSWDDPATRLAIERYMAGVRDDAPWCPWNIEFIRRVNGLESVDDVYRTVFDAEYLVLGLGDVYLGAPVATPVDPRHRLVTTKYNPARTWTAENSVGIGGAYLCIYGMEGPGGYQFVGRTVQVWGRHRVMQGGERWLLRFFDRISWYPVSADELLELRAEMAAGRLELEISEGTFSLAEHEAFLAREADSIAAFRSRQGAAFAAERAAWAEAGEFEVRDEQPSAPAAESPVAETGRPAPAPAPC